jgi:hypothetical protein
MTEFGKCMKQRGASHDITDGNSSREQKTGRHSVMLIPWKQTHITYKIGL